MSFTGNLKTISLPDIFQLIFSTKKTGILVISKGGIKKEIYFRNGFVIYASSTEERDLFGNLLLKMGRISKAELDKVLREKKEGKKIGGTLVEMNLFTREEIMDCLRLQIEETIYSLFGWKDGDFNFIEGKAPPPESIQTELNPMNIIMEGTRRIDEWTELKRILPSDEANLLLEKTPDLRTEEIRLNRNEILIMACIGSGKKMADLLRESSLDQFLTSKALANLIQNGLVKVGKVVEEKKPEVDETDELVKLLANIYRHNFDTILQNLKDKMGSKGEKIYTETFQERRSDYPLLSNYLNSIEGKLDYDLLLKLVKSLPKEACIHRIIVNFNDLLSDYLLTIQKYLGKKMYKRTLSQIRIQTQNNINSKKQLSLKYGLEDEFSRALKGSR
jgi:hypothetical protein